MSLHDKVLCTECKHPKHRHTGNHLKGTRTACLKRQPRCECREFKDPFEDGWLS